MTVTAPRLHGVLVTYRRPADLGRMLSSLAAQDHPLDQLVVVDNDASSDVAALVRRHRDAEYIAAPENLGPAGGIALGMQRCLELAADEDWIVTLDDDDPPSGPSVLGGLAAFAAAMSRQDPRVGAVGLVGARLDRRRGRLVRPGDHELTGPVPVDYVGGNAFPTYSAGVVRSLGPFRTELFFGFDDLEYGVRVRRAGYSIYADGHAWRRKRAEAGRLNLDLRPDRRLADASWRRFYSLRNMIWLLRSGGHRTAALRVTAIALGKPLLNVAHNPAAGLAHLRLNARACRDGWRSRLGRTVEPVAKA